MTENESKQPAELTGARKELIDQHFSGEKKASVDVLNWWSAAIMAAEAEMWDELGEIPSYKDSFPKYTPAELAYTLQKSDTAVISEYDALTEAYNNDLPRIKREKDKLAIKTFMTRAERLIRGTSPIG